MAAEEEWVCPICRDERKDIAYAMPCRHKFCLGCILRWGKQHESCPLCRRVMEVVKVAALEDDEDLDFVIWPPATPVPACFQEAVAASFSSSSSSLSSSPPPSPWSDEEEDEDADDEETEDEEAEVEAEELPTVGGLPADIWAELFRQHQHILDPVLPWLRQQLRAVFPTHWWPAMAAEAYLLHGLCEIGPDREWLTEMTRAALQNRAEEFVQELLDNIVRHCGEEAHRLLGLQDIHVPEEWEEGPAARGQENSPTASPELDLTSGPGVSTACASMGEETRTAVADVPVSPGHVPAAHLAREAEEPHEEMEQTTAAGPSARSSSPSAPGHSPERARRPPKRRADSDQDPQPPCKRPPPRPH